MNEDELPDWALGVMRSASAQATDSRDTPVGIIEDTDSTSGLFYASGPGFHVIAIEAANDQMIGAAVDLEVEQARITVG